MLKGRISTLILFCLSFAVVTGGWYLTEKMLDRRQEQVLGESGVAYRQSAELESLDEDEDGADAFEGAAFTESEIAAVLQAWDNADSIVPHEPEENQMNMGQAIAAGQNWVDTLAQCGALPEALYQCSFSEISAVLVYAENAEKWGIEDSYVCFWQVDFAKDDLWMTINVHAASGEIWRADISIIDDGQDQWEFPDDGAFETAFPFLDFDGTQYFQADTIECRYFPEENLRAVFRNVDNICDSQSRMRSILFCLERVDNPADRTEGSSAAVDSSKK